MIFDEVRLSSFVGPQLIDRVDVVDGGCDHELGVHLGLDDEGEHQMVDEKCGEDQSAFRVLQSNVVLLERRDLLVSS